MNDFEPISEDKLNKIFIEKKLNIDCKCRNENIYIDIQNKRIECAKCGAILDPFDVVYRLFYQEERYMEKIKFLRQQCEELVKENAELKAENKIARQAAKDFCKINEAYMKYEDCLKEIKKIAERLDDFTALQVLHKTQILDLITKAEVLNE